MVSTSDKLEALDKEALLALARDLDLKVSTRLRKAELVDLIQGARGGFNGHGPGAHSDSSNGSNGRVSGGREARAEEAATSSANGRDHRGSSPVRTVSAGAGSNGPVSGDLAALIPPITVAPAPDRQLGQARSDDRQESQPASRREPMPREAQPDGSSRRSRRRRNKDRQERSDAPESFVAAELVPVEGVLDLRDDGYGFVRTKGYLSSKEDVYVPTSLARKLALRRGDWIVGASRPASSSEKYPALVRVDSVAGFDVEEARRRPRFEDLTPLFPNERLTLEDAADPTNVAARIIDLVAPIGKGQRGLIVSPPKAGKTTIMKQIAHAIERNNPEVALIVLLVDERPEEVTDFRRSVRGEVVASTFDRPAEEHTQVAELTIERAKRMVELGRDVVVILDGITRLARAYNLAQPASGRIMSGGIDSGALYPPKKFFGAARNVEEGGSLTILATALVENGSKMDEVIFEEFKGTGNMELKLDRRLSERRLFPAVDVNGSSTRHEELLFSRDHLNQVWKLRRVLNAITQDGTAAAGLELLLDKVRSTRSNAEFLAEIARSSGV
jgi:transcription termination factor Rho